MINRITVYLVVTLFTMSLLPLLGALVLSDDIMKSQTAIYKNPSVNGAIDAAQTNLKRLAKHEPEREAELRAEFERLEDLKMVYGEDATFTRMLTGTLRKYFYFIFGACVLISLFVGAVLSRLIDRSFKKLLREHRRQLERARYLDTVAQWQGVARTLAHEIRRPLQPIKVWLSLITRDGLPPEKVREAVDAIDEDLESLKKMVDGFGAFGRLPEPAVKPVDLRRLVEQFAASRPTLTVTIEGESPACLCDPALTRQILDGLADNALEANGETTLQIEIAKRGRAAEVSVFNSGREIPEREAERIFEPYYSTKSGTGNMGLGLAIAKLHLIKQQGDIFNISAAGGALFRIRLPLDKGVDDAQI